MLHATVTHDRYTQSLRTVVIRGRHMRASHAGVTRRCHTRSLHAALHTVVTRGRYTREGGSKGGKKAAVAAEAADAVLDGEIWRDTAGYCDNVASYGEIWRDVARYGEIWQDGRGSSVHLTRAERQHEPSCRLPADVLREKAERRHSALGEWQAHPGRRSTLQNLVDSVRTESACTSRSQEALQGSCSPDHVQCGRPRAAAIGASAWPHAACGNAPAGKSLRRQRVDRLQHPNHLRLTDNQVRHEARLDFRCWWSSRHLGRVLEAACSSATRGRSAGDVASGVAGSATSRHVAARNGHVSSLRTTVSSDRKWRRRTPNRRARARPKAKHATRNRQSATAHCTTVPPTTYQ